MSHTNNFLFRAFALVALLSVSFNPLASSSKGEHQKVFSSAERLSSKLGDVTVKVSSSIDNAPGEQPTADTTIYLPIVMDNFYSYNGTITDNGIPVANQVVDLRFYDGTDWSTYDTQVTNTSGVYYFTNLPALIKRPGILCALVE